MIRLTLAFSTILHTPVFLLLWFSSAEPPQEPRPDSTQIAIKIVKTTPKSGRKHAARPKTNLEGKRRLTPAPHQPPSAAGGGHEGTGALTSPISKFMPDVEWDAATVEGSIANASRVTRSSENLQLTEDSGVRPEAGTREAPRLSNIARLLLDHITVPDELKATCSLESATARLDKSPTARWYISSVSGAPYLRALLYDQLGRVLKDPQISSSLAATHATYVKTTLRMELRAEPHKSRQPWYTLEGFHIRLHHEGFSPTPHRAWSLVGVGQSAAGAAVPFLNILAPLRWWADKSEADAISAKLRRYHTLPGFQAPIK